MDLTQHRGYIRRTDAPLTKTQFTEENRPMRKTIAEAFAEFEQFVVPAVIAAYGADDIPARAEAWNAFTDALAKDGQLNPLQYHYCPSEDGPMPDDDLDYIIKCMGIGMTWTRAPSPANTDTWPAGSSHWNVTITRGGESVGLDFYKGPALKGPPDIKEVLHCLVSDTVSFQNSDGFEAWAEDLGFDPDSRKAEKIYREVEKQAAELANLFTPDELDGLADMFSDY